jgi:histidyl-tRNA synthetase
MAKANTAPISGMRDFLPLDVLRRNYVIDVIERVYQSYGFEPLETPVMERLSTLLGKYGEDEKLIFRVMKRGDKLATALSDHPTEDSVGDAGMRYDLTVPLARVVAQYRNDLPTVFKRYQIQPVYRADRPAKGRYREFYQCDLDIVGSTGETVEAEVLNAGAQVLLDLGFGDRHPFAIRLNHRGILRGLLEVAGVPPTLEDTALVAIDKLDKIGIDSVSEELAARGISQDSAERLLNLMAAAPVGNDQMLTWLTQVLAESKQGMAGVASVKTIFTYCHSGPAGAYLRADPYLARGLSYYTGPIFEIDFPGLSSSGGGGGRYDELIGMFSGQRIPACGFSFGLERILLVMQEEEMFPQRLAGQPQALVTLFDEETIAPSLALAQELRTAGLRVDVYPDPDRYGKQFRYAEERGIRYALLMGPRELGESVVAIKDLETGEQTDVAHNELAQKLLGISE